MRCQSGSNKVAIELRVVQFWSEITRMISDQIALYSVNLPLFITESHCMHYIEMGGQGVNGGGVVAFRSSPSTELCGNNSVSLFHDLKRFRLKI